MTLADTVKVIEQRLLCRSLSPSEREVLLQSFSGRSYEEIAQGTNYTKGYLKIIGAKLWQELSQSLGQKITKKNIQSVLERHLQSEPPRQQTVSSTGAGGPADIISVGSRSMPDDPGVRSHYAPSGQLDGPVPFGSPFYIERPPLETQAHQAIGQPGCLLRIKAPRRYGKSSLLLRLIDHGVSAGCKSVVVDFQEADRTTLGSLPRLLRWVCANFIQQLSLAVNLNEIWNPELGNKLSCKIFLQEQVLGPSDRPIIWAINEVDRVFEFPEVARGMLSFLRTCYEQAQGSPIWYKLRLVMVYSTEVYVPLQLNQSPFNVGMALMPPPFNLAQVTELAQRYGLDLSPQQLGQLMVLLGGQPYLFNLTFYHLSVQSLSFSELLLTAPTLSGIYGNHLQECLALLLEQPILMEALVQLGGDGQTELEPVAAYRLVSMGLLTLAGHQVRISCQLYQDYLRYALPQFAASLTA